MTKRIKILFIMFQGGHSNLKSWNEYTESKFLDRLKTIGSVYCYQDKTYNIWHYDKSHPEYKDYDMDIDINLSYVRPDTHIKNLYRDIISKYKNIDEYKFIPIGWSLGCWLALYFAQVYSSQCSHVILLESSLFTQNNMKIRLKDLGNMKNFSSVTNAKYKKMLLDWKTNNTNIEDAEKIRDLNTYIRAQFISKHLNLKLPVPTTAFVNIKIVKEEKDLINNKQKLDEVKILEKHNPSNYKAIIFNDKSHYIFDKIQPAKAIIKEIKSIVYIPTKNLYHGSPYLLKKLIPMLPRGCDDFNSQTAVYLSSNKIEAKLYSLARDKERKNKGWGIKNCYLYLRKERWLENFMEPEKPLYRLNDIGYLYIINMNKVPDYEINPHNMNEYIIKNIVKPDRIEKVYYNDVKNRIKYVSKEEMDKIFT
jgi:hypothetical protein